MSKNFFIVPFVSIMILGLAGCDMVDSIKDNLSGSKKSAKPLDKQAPAQKAAPVAAPAPKPSPAEAPQATPPIPANVLASVGSWTITLDEFNKRLDAVKQAAPEADVSNSDVKGAILNDLIRQQLIVADAEKSGVGNKPEIAEAVKEFKNALLVQEIVRSLTENVKVTEEEAKKFFDENKDKLLEPKSYHVREIVVGSQAKAAELFAEVMKPEVDFATIAKDNSISKSAPQGGDLGFLDQAPFEEMGKTVLGLKVGDISNPFTGPEGIYIVKLEEVKGGNTYEYEVIKNDIINNETITKQDKIIMDYLDKLQKEIKVQVNVDLLLPKQ
ncbi:MAG: peptidyl-prolyl cis-trans isomerase [Candidatus Omnitrophica bacterium]|nr:peptidyl-prolyl cis-trans isomerase [Candidatus Omnitrophota bacterium]